VNYGKGENPENPNPWVFVEQYVSVVELYKYLRFCVLYFTIQAKVQYLKLQLSQFSQSYFYFVNAQKNKK